MAQTIRGLTVNGRRLGVLAAPGDRRDEDILDLARAAAPAFDFILLREDDRLRGRKPGESGELLRQGLLASGFPADRIAPGIYAEEQAVQSALETAQPGDLLVIFGDKLDRSWHQIVTFGQPAGAPAVPMPFMAPVFASDEPPLASAILAAEQVEERRAGEHED
jgi:cyanophycin synthetase